MAKWDGKTKGSLSGYKFFVFLINNLGVRFSYFFCIFVAGGYIVFSSKARRGLTNYYQVGFGLPKGKARRKSFSNFYIFGKTLIDRIAVTGRKRKLYSYDFNNEKALREMNELGRGGILYSAHLGNWESAGNLISDRITNKINILMLDAEVEKIKDFLNETTGGPQYNIIPLKDDLSHLILIHRALKRGELIAVHADRVMDDSNSVELPFLNGKAKFPIGPFILAEKFKVPVTFVYAMKGTKFHYEFYATDLSTEPKTAHELAAEYVKSLENMVRKYPNQWFNFYHYYAS